MTALGSSEFPDRIGVWRPERLIGRGAVAAVYLCRGPDGAKVAIKWMDAEMGAQIDRFSREIEVLSRLNHPGIVHYQDHGLHLDRPYLVMDFIDGQDLRVYALKLQKRPPAERYARTRTIGRALCESLESLHAEGLVHRDVKPSNVMIARDDRVVLTDFGVVKDTKDIHHTAVGVMVGTLAFAAPEQIHGELVDGRTDLYGLGGCLYYALTHRRPFHGVERQDGRGVPLVPPSPSRFDPGVPPDLEGLVMRMLAADPRRRPRSAASVRAMLIAEGPSGPQLAGTGPILKQVAKCLSRARDGESLLVRPTGPMGTRKSWVGDLLREGAQRAQIPVVEVVEAGAFQAVRARLKAREHLLVISPFALDVPEHVLVIEIPLSPLGVADVRRSLVLAAPLMADPAGTAVRVHDLTGGLPRLVAALLSAHAASGDCVLPEKVPLPPEMAPFFDGLDIDDIEVLGTIALAGTPIDPEIIEEVVQVPVDTAVETLVARGMVVELDNRVRLSGILFRTAVQELLPDPEGLMERLEAIMRARSPTTSASQRLLSDVREALERAEAAMVSGDVGPALEAARRSVVLAEGTGDGEVICESMILLGNILIRLGVLDEASRHLADATALAHAHGRNDLRRICHGLRAWVSLDQQPGSRIAASSSIDRILPMIAGAEARGHQPEDALLYATWARAAALIGDQRSWSRARDRALTWSEHVQRPLRLGIRLQLARGALAIHDRQAALAYIQPAMAAEDLPMLAWEAERIASLIQGSIMPEPGSWAKGLTPAVMEALFRRTP